MTLTRFASLPLSADDPSDGAPDDRSAHPSAQTSERTRPTGSISFRALRTIAAGLARVQQPLPPDGTDTPRSSRLIATAFYDVWLVTWPDGSGLGPHDHGNVRSVLQVVDGELTELACDTAGCFDPSARTLRRGSVRAAEPTVVHALTNRSGAEATSLHVYSPPLVDVTYVDLRPEGVDDPGHPAPVDRGPAPAVSPTAGPPAPVPLTLVRP